MQLNKKSKRTMVGYLSREDAVAPRRSFRMAGARRTTIRIRYVLSDSSSSPGKRKRYPDVRKCNIPRERNEELNMSRRRHRKNTVRLKRKNVSAKLKSEARALSNLQREYTAEEKECRGCRRYGTTRQGQGVTKVKTVTDLVSD